MSGWEKPNTHFLSTNICAHTQSGETLISLPACSSPAPLQHIKHKTKNNSCRLVLGSEPNTKSRHSNSSRRDSRFLSRLQDIQHSNQFQQPYFRRLKPELDSCRKTAQLFQKLSINRALCGDMEVKVAKATEEPVRHTRCCLCAHLKSVCACI